MEIVTEASAPGRWETTRKPSDADVKATGIIRMRIESGSAKRREGGPKDEKKDTDDEVLRKSTWSGHIPIRYVASEPVPSREQCDPADFPSGPTQEVTALANKFQ